ncbi:MAG: hypothetical protein K8H88_10670 [Sandaracinaceae bacterium]|nr:hypothetical protein [Sandaracinaceae bacterium]
MKHHLGHHALRCHFLPHALFLLLLSSCEHGPQSSGRVIEEPARARPSAPSIETARPAARPARPGELPRSISVAGRIGWTAGEPFVSRRPENTMRVAEYGVRDHAGATLVVSHFGRSEGGGGSVRENIDRWIGQFTQPDGRNSQEVARIEERRVNDLAVTTIDVRGTFVGRMGMGPPQPPQASWRLLGAVVEGPEGLVFFKLTGPDADVTHAEAGLRALVDSIHPE